VIFTSAEDNLADVTTALSPGAGQTVHYGLTRLDYRELDRGTLTLVDNVIDQNTGYC